MEAGDFALPILKRGQTKKETIMKFHSIAAAALLALSTGLASAQTSPPATPDKSAPAAQRPASAATATSPRMRSADRDADLKNTKDQLEQMLKVANNRADYAQILEKNGYRISSINTDKKDKLEYEVVKGDRSYEVQLKFKDGAAKATDIDVANNFWRAPATKAMLKDNNYKVAGTMKADPDSRYSDSRYRKASDDEKDQLEKLHTANMTAQQFMAKVKDRGYKITATNDKEADYLEYEILKGDNSYEVQLDIDPKTKVIKEVDVATNVWDAEGTDRAKDAKKK
jgi:ribosomal protein S6